VLLGETKEELGGSQYLKEMHQLVKGDCPGLDLDLEKAVCETALDSISKGLVDSAHDCSEGGIAIALAECCISDSENMIGAVIDNLDFNIREDALLFGESQSRIILSCSKEALLEIKEIAKKHKAPIRVIGRTGTRNLTILNNQKKIIELSLGVISQEWRYGLERCIRA